MIVEKEFLSKIRDLGINSYEAKLWTALLSRGVATAGELSDIANVPRSRSYDVLESLERKGFIIMKLGKPIKYIAVPPHEVIDRVKQKIQEEAQSRDAMLDSLRESDVLEQLHGLYDTGVDHVEPNDVTGIVRGYKNVVSHLASVLKSAEKSIDIVSMDTVLVNDLKRSLTKAVKNNVKVRVIVPRKLTLGVKEIDVKMNAALKSRFIVVDDDEVVLMPVEDGSARDFAVWIKGESFAHNFVSMFESYWK